MTTPNTPVIDDAEALKQLLLRGWMTHDAMWFRNAYVRRGIEVANKLNRAVVRDMASIEVHRVLKALDMDGVSSFEEIETFVTGAMALLSGDYMTFRWEWRPPDRLYAQIDDCFAHKGVTRIGAIDKYQCGIYDRIYGWFDTLGIDYTVTPTSELCTMHHDGECVREIRFSFHDRP